MLELSFLQIKVFISDVNFLDFATRVLPDAPRLPLLPESSEHDSHYHHDSLRRSSKVERDSYQRSKRLSRESHSTEKRSELRGRAYGRNNRRNTVSDSDSSFESEGKSLTANGDKKSLSKNEKRTAKRKHQLSLETSDLVSDMSESTTRHKKKSVSKSASVRKRSKSRTSDRPKLGLISSKSDSESSDVSVTIVPRKCLNRKNSNDEETETRPKKMYRVKKSRA